MYYIATNFYKQKVVKIGHKSSRKQQFVRRNNQRNCMLYLTLTCFHLQKRCKPSCLCVISGIWQIFCIFNDLTSCASMHNIKYSTYNNGKRLVTK